MRAAIHPPEPLQFTFARSWAADTWCVVDTETTDKDPLQARVVELGLATFNPVQGCFHATAWRCNPQMPIPEEAANVHGLTDADVQEEPPFGDRAPLLLKSLGDRTVVGYNILAYDKLVLEAEYGRCSIHFKLPPILDVVVFVRWHLRHLRNRKLEAICSHCGIDLTHAHSAAADAHATGQLLLALVTSGVIPHEIELALEEQRRFLPLLHQEMTDWSYWIYRDRQQPNILRMGCGAAIGKPLSDVRPSLVRYYLDNIKDLPKQVRSIFGDFAR